MDALKGFPKTDTWLQTEKGVGVFQKMDIFKGLIWYAYKDNPMQWHQLSAERANEIIALNKNKKKAQSLEDYSYELNVTDEDEKVFANVVGQDSLTRFDKRKKRRRKNRNNNRRKKPRKNA
jgi:hypothetical protein